MKRSLYYVIFFLFTLFLLPLRVHAQETSWVDAGYAESMSAAAKQSDVNAAAHVSNVNTNNYSDFVRRVLGPVPGLTVSAADMNTPYAEAMRQQSAMAGLSNYIYTMYANPPASTYAFVQDMGQTLGFMPKKAYAQGIGFSGLVTLLPIWKAFRNISYALLAIIMVVIGFMVMFRKKIDPKTVVTVQNALPKIVITLILITFSYAIVGILIDLMYVVLILGVQLIVNASPTGMFDAGHITRISSSSFSAVNRGLLAGFNSLPDLMAFLFPGQSQLGYFALFNPVYDVVGVLIFVLLSLAFLFGGVRLFFMLLNAYIQIIISLITAPIQLLLDAVPGGNGFASWIKNLISHLIVFPITAICITVSWYLIGTSTKTWTPPMLGTGSGGVGGLIGLGMLFIIPNIVKGIQESLKAKPMVPMGAGAALSPITGAFQTGTQAVSGFYYGQSILQNLKTKPKPPSA